jgi:molybdopterin/thiamine biosynthesis adenylyltransferase
VAASLAASGVGHVHCVDGDTGELSNLVRPLLYTEADVGQPKAEVTAARLRALNSDIEVTAAVTELDGTEAIADAVAGSDAFVLCRNPHEINCPTLQVGTFIPGVTGCFECMMISDRERKYALGL